MMTKYDIDNYLRFAEESYNGNGWSTDNIHPPEQPYTISVANSTGAPLTTILFGNPLTINGYSTINLGTGLSETLTFNFTTKNMRKRKLLLVRARRISVKPKPRKTK